MWQSPDPRFDVASAICQGGRNTQEDAIVTDFPLGSDLGLVVLADGMGGHAAGEVASGLIVSQVYSDLKMASAAGAAQESQIPYVLTKATNKANGRLRDHIAAHPEKDGMGATLVSVMLVENRMFWMSVGDSPLYHLRDGALQQLNETHSMAPQIDFMAMQGLIDAEAARDHPDRNALTSALTGGKLARTDCPDAPFDLMAGDIVVVASDGLQYLEDAQIGETLHRHRDNSSAEIAVAVLDAIKALGDPDQDNVAFAVIKLNHDTSMVRGTGFDDGVAYSNAKPAPNGTWGQTDDDLPERDTLRKVAGGTS